MSALKLTRKLLTSIICLVLSLTFCVWAVFAWFARNGSVDATGMQVSVDAENVSMTVGVYSLSFSDSTVPTYAINTSVGTNGFIYSVDSANNLHFGNGIDDISDVIMPQYINSSICSAVLLKIEVVNNGSSSVELSLTSNGSPLPTSVEDILDVNITQNVISTQLSNAVTVYETQSEAPYTKGAAHSYFNASGTSPNKGTVTLSSQVWEVGSTTEYFILDYNSALIDYLNNLAIRVGAIVGSQYSFSSDLSFVLGAGGSSGDTHTHTWSDEWLYDDENHWYKCLYCNETSDLYEHSFTSTMEIVNGSLVRTEVCTDCGYTRNIQLTQSAQYTISAGADTDEGSANIIISDTNQISASFGVYDTSGSYRYRTYNGNFVFNTTNVYMQIQINNLQSGNYVVISFNAYANSATDSNNNPTGLVLNNIEHADADKTSITGISTNSATPTTCEFILAVNANDDVSLELLRAAASGTQVGTITIKVY